MEFFEKAHVSKNSQNVKKDKKTEQSVKKQLKQMLYGYKQSDIEIIKKSEMQINDFDDSTSVSGFSDLNLSNTSCEDNSTKEIICFDNRKGISDIDELSLFESSGVDERKSEASLSDIDQPEADYEDSIESISGYNHDMKSLSEDISSNTDELPNNDSSSYVSRDDVSENSSTQSEMFDPNGELASRILLKLEKNAKDDHITGKLKKRKKVIDNKDKKLLEENTHANNEIVKLNTSDNISPVNLPYVNDSNNLETFMPLFLSVDAAGMQDQSFDDVLGEYRHPTIRNTPFESHNLGSHEVEFMNTSDHLENDNEIIIKELQNDHCNDIDEVDLNTEQDTSMLITLHDQTNSYDSTMQSECLERDYSSESHDTSFVQTVSVYHGNNCCVFVMKHPAEMYIHGKVQVNCLAGTVTVHGYSLNNEFNEVYAPNYTFAQKIQTVDNQNEYYGLFRKLTSSGLSVSEAEEIVTSIKPNDGVICMEVLKSREMDFVENNFLTVDLFSKPSKYIESCFKKASSILDCSLYLTRPWNCLIEDVSWKQTAKYASYKNSRGIICGGKGCGKSTFLRYCVNRLLENGPVLVIDLDPGQCEFTVAGNVSATVVNKPLIGPNFTHLKKPDLMLNIGIINTMDNPTRYANAIKKLIDDCYSKPDYKEMPWIINTMGMCNDVGLKFITLVILMLRPTYLHQIDSKNVKRRFDCYLDSSNVRKLYIEKYQNTDMFKDVLYSEDIDYYFILAKPTSIPKDALAPRDVRYLNYLAYFGQMANLSKSMGLLEITPYQVHIQDLRIGCNVSVAEETITKVLNGKIIALCEMSNYCNKNKVFLLEENPLECHGIGLIRGIDFEKGDLYVLTPISIEELSKVNTIVYADWVPEIRGQEKHLPNGIPIPYRTSSQYQQRQLMYAPRRRFNPVQLLKMSKKPCNQINH